MHGVPGGGRAPRHDGRGALRLPSFRWYGSLWAASETTLAGRFTEAERLIAEAREAGARAGDRNAEMFPAMVAELGNVGAARVRAVRPGLPRGQGRKLARRPGVRVVPRLGARRPGPHGGGATSPRRVDATGAGLRRQLALRPGGGRRGGRAPRRPGRTRLPTRRLAPYAGRPATSGRAVSSYGAVDRQLGGLAAVLGRGRTPSGTCARGSRGTPSSGARSGALHGLRRLYALAPDDAARGRGGCRGAGARAAAAGARVIHRGRVRTNCHLLFIDASNGRGMLRMSRPPRSAQQRSGTHASQRSQLQRRRGEPPPRPHLGRVPPQPARRAGRACAAGCSRAGAASRARPRPPQPAPPPERRSLPDGAGDDRLRAAAASPPRAASRTSVKPVASARGERAAAVEAQMLAERVVVRLVAGQGEQRPLADGRDRAR